MSRLILLIVSQHIISTNSTYIPPHATLLLETPCRADITRYPCKELQGAKCTRSFCDVESGKAGATPQRGKPGSKKSLAVLPLRTMSECESHTRLQVWEMASHLDRWAVKRSPILLCIWMWVGGGRGSTPSWEGCDWEVELSAQLLSI